MVSCLVEEEEDRDVFVDDEKQELNKKASAVEDKMVWVFLVEDNELGTKVS